MSAGGMSAQLSPHMATASGLDAEMGNGRPRKGTHTTARQFNGGGLVMRERTKNGHLMV